LASTVTEESNPMRQHWPDQPEYEGATLVGAGAMVLAGAAIVGLVVRLWSRLRRP
jgi:hypothetical protein